MSNQSLRTAKGERIAIVSGLRTPFARRDTGFKDAYATSLGTMVTNELLSRTALSRQEIDQLVFAQVITSWLRHSAYEFELRQFDFHLFQNESYFLEKVVLSLLRLLILFLKRLRHLVRPNHLKPREKFPHLGVLMHEVIE